MMHPSHQAVADQMREEARCRPWRRLLIGDRIRELEDLEAATEDALIRYARAVDDLIAVYEITRDAVLHLRELLSYAGRCWAEYELDIDGLLERIEHELIALRGLGRDLGAV
jgi:hypothetical protein